jgi:membrane protein DedA with SNARE-associated domain
MPWPRFLLFNALGGIVWATVYGLGGYFLGEQVHQLSRPAAIVFFVLAVIVIVVSLIFLRRNEKRLEEEAVRAIPDPLV